MFFVQNPHIGATTTMLRRWLSGFLCFLFFFFYTAHMKGSSGWEMWPLRSSCACKLKPPPPMAEFAPHRSRIRVCDFCLPVPFRPFRTFFFRSKDDPLTGTETEISVYMLPVRNT